MECSYLRVIAGNPQKKPSKFAFLKKKPKIKKYFFDFLVNMLQFFVMISSKQYVLS